MLFRIIIGLAIYALFIYGAARLHDWLESEILGICPEGNKPSVEAERKKNR